MNERICEDWFQLIYIHYNYINIFQNNEKYRYKSLGIFKRNNNFVLKFDIVETNTIQNEPTKDYRTDTIFNQEPRILETWEREFSSTVR